jgi:hypothetical protein
MDKMVVPSDLIDLAVSGFILMFFKSFLLMKSLGIESFFAFHSKLLEK